MRFFICVILTFGLLGCQSTEHTISPPNKILNDSQFKQQNIETKAQVFALSDETKASLEQAVRPLLTTKATVKTLLHYIFKPEYESLNYLSGATFTAEETFTQKNANCLSLSIMAHSMAKHLGLETQFQQVFIPEYWASESGFSLLTGHVNLKIIEPVRNKYSQAETIFDASGDLLIDFNPMTLRKRFRSEVISDDLILAMFYNNKGAAAMIERQDDLAYSYFTAAIKVAPQYSSSFGNLGVLYRLRNQYDLAEEAYNHALLLSPDNNTAKGNLALLYDLTERSNKARKLRIALERARSKNPYYSIALGNEALAQADYTSATRWFKKSIRLDKRIHESYFGLAKAYFLQGELSKAQIELQRAEKLADFDSDKRRYQGKLMSLSAQLIQ